MLAAALDLAARGFRILPVHTVVKDRCSCPRGKSCGSKGKHPRPAAWQSRATSDPSLIRAWWGRNPESNIGIACGGPGRLVVVDVDGPEGRATLATLEAEHGALPVTLTSRSGRPDGGEHRFFAVPPDLDMAALRNARIGPKVDLRTEGGQVVAPPSMHASGARYAWIDLDTPIAPLPRWLYEVATREAPTPAPPVEDARTRPVATRESRPGRWSPIERARAYLDRYPPAVSGQGGHARALLAAEHVVRGFRLSDEDAFAVLQPWNRTCVPPWSERELRHKIQQAREKGTAVRWGEDLDKERPLPPRTNGASVCIMNDPTDDIERAAIQGEDASEGGEDFEPTVLAGPVPYILARIQAAPKASQSDVAHAPDILAYAATLDEQSDEWRVLYDGLRRADVRLLPWRRAVRTRRTGPPDAAPSEDGRPRIVITTDELEVNDAAIAALSKLENLYQRGAMLVDVVREPSSGDIQRPEGTASIRALPLARLRELLASAARWTVRRVTSDGSIHERPAHPPDWTVRAIHARGAWEGIPPLRAVVECPVLRPDGSILAKPGYDDATGILYAPSGDFPEVPERPTREDAKRAAAEILDVVSDFPFASDVDRAAWLAGLLTPLARHAFAGNAPMFLVSGNVRAAGKGLLVAVIAHIVAGRGASSFSQVESEDEERKRITSIALAGDAMVMVDNITRPFGSGTFDKALTDTVWNERLLGANTLQRLPLLSTWYGTGNNVAFASRCDTARRCAIIRIVSPHERPEDRADFRYPDLLGHVRAKRARLLTAALTILRAWIVSGCQGGAMRPWGSFEAWSRIVRGAVVWIGLPDPGEARGSADEEHDTEAAALAELLAGWEEAARELAPDRGAVSIAAVLSSLHANDQERAAARPPYTPPAERFPRLRAALAQLIPGVPVGKLPNAMQVGALLRRYRERVIGGRMLHARKSHGDNVWTVTSARSAVAPLDSGP